MQYRNLLVKSAILAMSLNSISALAGQGTGNGGGAIVCRDADGAVVGNSQLPAGAALLDLWLAETLPRVEFGGKHLVMARSNYPWDWQVENMLYQVYQAAPGYYSVLKAEVDYVEPDFKSPDHILNVKQERINDSSDFLTPEGCNRSRLCTMMTALERSSPKASGMRFHRRIELRLSCTKRSTD